MCLFLYIREWSLIVYSTVCKKELLNLVFNSKTYGNINTKLKKDDSDNPGDSTLYMNLSRRKKSHRNSYFYFIPMATH